MMQTSPLIVLVAASLFLAACGDDKADSTTSDSAGTTGTTAAAGTTSTTDTAGTTAPTSGSSGDTTETATETGEPAVLGMPEGISAWEGDAGFAGFTLPLAITITNTNGDLTASITLSDDPDTPVGFGMGVYSATGTHEPTAGLVALAPETWTIEPDPPIELLGFMGSYDPATKRLTGMIVDYATGDDNTLTGGVATLDLVDGPGEPTVRGAEGSSLVVGSQKFSGTTQCTGPTRATEGTLDYDGAGGVAGTITLGDPDLTSTIGTFAVTGVHNPSTGGITLVPGLWLETQDSKLTNFVDGTYDSMTKKYDGDQRTNVAACPPATWKTTFE
jgi:hypothetical protein